MKARFEPRDTYLSKLLSDPPLPAGGLVPEEPRAINYPCVPTRLLTVPESESAPSAVVATTSGGKMMEPTS